MTVDSTVSALIEGDRRHHFHANTNPVEFAKSGPILVQRAQGVYLYTADGREIIDGMSGGWCTNIGYGNERLAKVAYDSMKQLCYAHTFAGKTNPWAAALSEKMAAITPSQYRQFFFASTGSDAVESAIKMALYYWGLRGQPDKRIIIGREFAYHGNTLFAAHLVGAKGYGAPYGFPLTDVVHMVDAPYWYRFGRGRSPEAFGRAAAQALEDKIRSIGPEKVAAFIGEPIQATLGLIIPPDSYWPEIERICKQYDVLLIADEVVTGMGKTGNWFGFQGFQFEPDLFTLAKGFASGYFPISCVAIGEKVGSILQNADRLFAHGFTNCGHPVGCAVALENIGVIEDEKLVERVAEDIGPYLALRLREFQEFPIVGEVNSKGIIGSIEIDLSRVRSATIADSVAWGTRIGEMAWDRGLHVRPIGSTLGMMFPMIVTRLELDKAFRILKEVFSIALQ
jgi:putrescine---pyruvate transaminase